MFNPEVRLYTVRFRHYSPKLRRWIERDPLGYTDGMNTYAYCGGNPVACVDPMGLEKHTLTATGSAGGNPAPLTDATRVKNIMESMRKGCPDTLAQVQAERGDEIDAAMDDGKCSKSGSGSSFVTSAAGVALTLAGASIDAGGVGVDKLMASRMDEAIISAHDAYKGRPTNLLKEVEFNRSQAKAAKLPQLNTFGKVLGTFGVIFGAVGIVLDSKEAYENFSEGNTADGVLATTRATSGAFLVGVGVVALFAVAAPVSGTILLAGAIRAVP